MAARDTQPGASAWRHFAESEPQGSRPHLFKSPYDGLVRIGARRRFGWGIGWAYDEAPIEGAPGVFKESTELARDGWLWAEIPE